MKDYFFEHSKSETKDEFGNPVTRCYDIICENERISIKAYEVETQPDRIVLYQRHDWHLQLREPVDIDACSNQITRLICENDYDYPWLLNHFPEKMQNDINELLYGTLTKPCR